jgi:hypothetical protein
VSLIYMHCMFTASQTQKQSTSMNKIRIHSNLLCVNFIIF